MQPISVVQGEGFRYMIGCLEPRYQIPHRKTFMERELPKLYQKTRDRVFAITNACEYFALTTDCWSSRANESFIGITFHSITKDWELKTFTLDNRALPESHTSENLAEALRKVLLDCDLEESHISAVTVHGQCC